MYYISYLYLPNAEIASKGAALIGTLLVFTLVFVFVIVFAGVTLVLLIKK